MAIYIFHLFFPEASLDQEVEVGLGPSPAQPPSSTVTLGRSPLQATLLNSLDQSRVISKIFPRSESLRSPLL